MIFGSYDLETEAMVNTKYKTMAKIMKLVATELPPDFEDHIKKVEEKPRLRGRRHIGHTFTIETLAKLKIGGDEVLNEAKKEKFQKIIFKHGKVFAFYPMVIFIILHLYWILKPIHVPRALLPKLVNVLKEKFQMGII